ncbi:hypothetical protein J0910_14515 [Nocardiopsis sp. CNT-189]|uniref:hypothetical protein n=1 Tax=Nocardiopsis oceanisediminis TaxID=2816862 RepID=UPI003B32D4B1
MGGRLPRELRDRFVRGPLGPSGGADHRPPSPGMRCFTGVHGTLASPGTPPGVMVGHTGKGAAPVPHGRFKLVIGPVAEPWGRRRRGRGAAAGGRGGG